MKLNFIRKFCFLVLSFFLSFCFSQQKCNNALKSEIFNKTLGKENFDVLIKGNIEELIAHEKSLGIKIKYFEGDISCVNLNVNSLQKTILSNLVSYIEYIEPPKQFISVLADSMLSRNRISKIKSGFYPLKKSYNGSGVIIGIIDTGIDINHPDFKDEKGNTRVQYLWEQKTDNSNAPLPFSYGTEWNAEQINKGICKHKDVLQNGHGTLVSGVAAGNGKAGNKYEGIASKSDLIVVALDFNRVGPNIADAVKYIVTKAEMMGKPFVINISVGNYYGSHDGSDLQTKLIDKLISDKSGRALVAAAGNAGSIKMHTKGNCNGKDVKFTWITSSSQVLEYFLYSDTNEIKNIKYSIGVNRPGYKDYGNIGFKTSEYCLSEVKADTLKYKSKRIGIIQSSASINQKGIYELYVRIFADSLYYLWRIESTGKGFFDSWNFNFVSKDLPTQKLYPKIKNYVMPDTISTIVSGFQCSEEVITVGNYINNDKSKNNGVKSNSINAIAENSSCGPTRDKRIKPDITATGSGVISCLSDDAKNKIKESPYSGSIVDENYLIVNGTSISSAVVTGAIALILESNPTATNKMVKEAIIRSAYKDEDTGLGLPNSLWGYGKLDGLKAFTK